MFLERYVRGDGEFGDKYYGYEIYFFYFYLNIESFFLLLFLNYLGFYFILKRYLMFLGLFVVYLFILYVRSLGIIVRVIFLGRYILEYFGIL